MRRARSGTAPTPGPETRRPADRRSGRAGSAPGVCSRLPPRDDEQRDRGECRDRAPGPRRARRRDHEGDGEQRAGGDRDRAERVAGRPQPALRDRAREQDREACRYGRSGAARQRRRERADRQRQRQRRGEVAQVEREPERVAGGAGGGLGRDQVRREREQRHGPQHPHDAVGIFPKAQQRADDGHREHRPPPTAEAGGQCRLGERAPEVRARQVVGDRVAGVLLEGGAGVGRMPPRPVHGSGLPTAIRLRAYQKPPATISGPSHRSRGARRAGLAGRSRPRRP